MTFTEIQKLMVEEGSVARRKSWQPHKVITAQIPATINEDIIPKMTSLSSSAKKFILNTAKQINYKNQIIIYDVNTGDATNYVLTIEDIVADDWVTVNID